MWIVSSDNKPVLAQVGSKNIHIRVDSSKSVASPL